MCVSESLKQNKKNKQGDEEEASEGGDLKYEKQMYLKNACSFH